MKTKSLRNSANLIINLVLLALFVLLGTLSFKADSTTVAAASPTQVEMDT